MAELQTEEDTDDKIQTNSNEDIDSKIADFMADIDEIVLGKRPSHSTDHPDKDDNGILNGATEREHSDRMSVWQKCFDETSQAVYYWNTDTNECSWDPPSTLSDECRMATRPIDSTLVNSTAEKKRSSMDQDTVTNGSVKKFKKPSLISAYTSSESESDDEEEDVEEEEEKDDHDEDDIDELLNEVLDKDDSSSKVHTNDSYPSFEEDCRAAIARLIDLGDRTTPMLTLRIQLETRLEDVLAGHLSKSYAVSKLQEAVLLIETFEKSESPPPPPPIEPPTKPPLTSTDMALLLSQPPPPPPSSPPPPPLVSSTSNDEDNKALELFYAQLNCDGQIETISDPALTLQPMIPVEKSSTHHHHRKDKKSKPAKTLPTGLIEKWAQARQELRGDLDDVDET